MFHKHLYENNPALFMVFDGDGGIMVLSALLAVCERNPAVTGGFPLLKASDAELLFFLFWWDIMVCLNLHLYLPKVFHLREACHWLNIIQYEDVLWLEEIPW